MISITPFVSSGVVDPTRIAAQIVIGIGFIGAGAIINQGDIILGLTTAASLWATAAIGMASGAGLYELSLVATVFVYLTLSLFKLIEKRFNPNLVHGVLKVEAASSLLEMKKIELALEEVQVRSKNIKISKGDTLNEYNFLLELPPNVTTETIIERVLSIEGVHGVGWEGALYGRSI